VVIGWLSGLAKAVRSGFQMVLPVLLQIGLDERSRVAMRLHSYGGDATAVLAVVAAVAVEEDVATVGSEENSNHQCFQPSVDPDHQRRSAPAEVFPGCPVALAALDQARDVGEGAAAAEVILGQKGYRQDARGSHGLKEVATAGLV